MYMEPDYDQGVEASPFTYDNVREGRLVGAVSPPRMRRMKKTLGLLLDGLLPFPPLQSTVMQVASDVNNGVFCRHAILGTALST